MSEPFVRAIVQARMLSRRLRGKSLMAVSGTPLLGRVLGCIAEMPFVDEVVVATSDQPADDPLAAFVEVRGVRCVRGPQDDVLHRFVLASEALGDDDLVLRFTADNPLYDPALTAMLVKAHRDFGGDYTGIDHLSPLVPECVRVGALHRAGREATAAYDREHVTPYLRARRDGFRVQVLPGDFGSMRPDLARYLTLDTEDDLTRIEELIDHLEAQGQAPTPEGLYGRLDALLATEEGRRSKTGSACQVALAGREVGEGHPTWVIAEIGQNHNGDLETARRLIDMAARCGADAVKFQKRDIRHDLTAAMYAMPYIHRNSFGPTYGAHREFLEFDEEQHRTLRDYAEARGLVWFCTACDAPSVDLLERLDNPVYKVASRDIANIPLLQRVAKTGKPVILSTGMAGLDDVRRALEALGGQPAGVVLLQCVSQYPTDVERVNLRAMETLRDTFGVPVGLSDHTSGVITAVAASVLGACMVEKHITLSRAMKGTDHAGALEEDGLRRVVKYIRQTTLAMGDGRKSVDPAVADARAKLARSLTSRTAIPAGSVLSEADLTLKSPGTGLAWHERDRLVGRVAARDIPADVTLSEADVVDEG